MTEPTPEPAAAGETPAPLTPEQEAAKAAANRAANIKIGLIVGAIMLCCIGVFVKQQVGSSSDPESDRSNTAVTACEDSVRNQLKAPSTAKFSGERYTDNDPSWLVTGSVDAQNSFGAMIRSSFRCTLTRSGDQMITTSANVS